MVTSALEENSLSLAVNRSTYVPAVENVAVVLNARALANVTVPGPLTLVHITVSALPNGKPSSVAVPTSLTGAGSVIT